MRGGGEEESEGLKTECPCLCRCWTGQESRRAGGSRGWKRQDADSSLEPHRPILDFRPPPPNCEGLNLLCFKPPIS